MGNNLHKIEKDLRSIAKRYKSVKYSIGLAILFLMLGISAFSEEVNIEKSPAQIATREELKTSVGDVQTKLNVLRNENKKEIENSKLELIQLMEQGDQVVKSPWASWQFGVNYFHEKAKGEYKGRGDKPKKYVYNAEYQRGDWKERNAMDTLENQKVGGTPLTPGNDSQASWKNVSSTSSGGVVIEKNTAINSSTNGNRSWGLVDLLKIKEPTNEVEILARISPKEVNKKAVPLNIKEPKVEGIKAPVVKPNVNTPLPAPEIKLLKIEAVVINPLNITAPNAPSVSVSVNAPSAPSAPTAPTVPSIKVEPGKPGTVTAPTISINVTSPTITPLTITTPGSVGTINVTAPSVNPVDFILPSAELSDDGDRNFQGYNSYVTYNQNLKNIVVNRVTNGSGGKKKGNYISTWGYVKDLDKVAVNVTVDVDNTRAFMVDEGIDEKDTTVAPFRYTGTINLNKSQNVGIDVQGTHTSYDKVAYGVNKDNKYNNINTVANVKVTNAGIIIGNGGAGIKNQVAFGFNNFDASTNNTRTEMINVGTITLNAEESAGIQLRPENPNAAGNTSDTRGLNMMTAYNKGGTITLNGNGSFGMLTVQNKDASGNPVASKNYSNYGTTTSAGGQIASRAQKENMSYMKNTGTINVGGTSSIGIGHLHNIQGVYAGGIINVSGASSVGVYTSVATRAVLAGKNDDHGLKNNTGKTVGTETVEVSGKITVSGVGSSGVYAKDTGSITLKDNKNNTDADADNKTTAKIEVTGTKSYGAVLDGVALNLEENTEISVTGKEAIGYVLKSGTGSNKGTISVMGNAGNTDTSPSLGFYGEKGTFTNEKEGTISSTGNFANAVALVGETISGISFTNNGKIKTTGKGNIGVYADGKYTFEHSGTDAKISVGTNAVGIYAKNTDGTLNIKAPIDIAASGTGTGTDKGTTIGIYSDGNANVKFGDNSKLTIGEGAVGLYSSDASKFNNTFEIESGKKLTVELAKNSTFGLLNGATAKDVPLSKYLNNGTTDKIAITQFGEGASLFYATSGAKAVLDEDYTVTNGNAESTSVLVANNGATVKIASGKKLTTNTNVGLIANAGGAVAENEGTLESTRADKGIGIYAKSATGKNTKTATTTATITMSNQNAVGMLGVIGSTLINTGKIGLGGVSSAGMYGEDSDLTNSGNSSKITVNKEASAGMYAKMTKEATAAKVSKNEGTIEILADGDGKSAGMYSLMASGSTKKITTENTGTLEVAQDESAGIFANNESGQANAQSEVLSSGLIKMTGIKSVGIIGKKSKITNSGTGAKGIEISGAGSAGILATNESEVINSGRIEGNTGASLVGISVDKDSTASNSGTITMKTTSNTGISSTGGAVTNTGSITLEKDSSTGISSVNGNVTNSNGATIIAQEGSSVGIYAEIAGKDDITVSNAGTISLTNATPAPSTLPEKSAAIYSLIQSGTGKLITTNTGTINVDQTKSVGIYAENNGGARDNSDVTNSGFINVNKDSSAGILAEKAKVTNTGTGTTGGIILSAIKTAGIIGNAGSLVSNTGRIETSGVTPANDKEGLVGISLNASTGTNTGEIKLGTKYSTGMFGAASSTVINQKKIIGTEEYIVGMAGDNSTVTNEKTIKLDGKNSTGLFGQNNSTLLNEAAGTITLGEESSVGIYSAATNISALNKGAITALKKSSAGMLGNKGDIKNQGTITISAEGSAGMLGIVDKTTTGSTYNLALKNSGNINIAGKESAGMMLTNESASIGKDKVTAENTGTITLSSTTATDNKNIGIYVDKKATGTNAGTIDVKTKESVGMFVQKDGEVTNKKAINIEGESGVGIFVADDTSTGTNASITGVIKLLAPQSVGIFAKDNGNTYSAQNAGTISLENPDKTKDYTSLIGMFAQGTTGKKASVKNTGTINIGTKESVGMYAENNTGNLADVDLHNAGTININSKSSAGIYAPKSTVSKVGEINLKDSVDSNGSSAVYISEGGKVADTATAIISLGTANQNRVAYYVDGKNGTTGDYTALAGANIGKITGYGVGVYLKGNSTKDDAKIDGATPKLDYTVNGATGDGIIGLFLDGNTNIAAYNKGITVGNSVGVNTTAPKYAIGIYAKAQGDPAGAAYNITTPIKVGADGVGIYADKDSHINYIGTIEAGDGTTAGTGVFITKKEGANAGKVTITGSTIKLKGTGGVGVIASEGTTIDAKNATVELIGNNIKGVGIYAKKGSTVDTTGWTFKNNGNQAEEVRSEEGQVAIGAGLKLLNPRMVLSHVINGETYVAAGGTVRSQNDGSHTAKENIGLMAEGVKNPTAPTPLTWDEGKFEAVNNGTIDFTIADRSTAIYVNSARAKNNGVINVGKNSTAIYGFYDKNTRTYEVPIGSTALPNVLEVKTTAASNISLGDQSTGMYLINAETVTNDKGSKITSTTGATGNVGIYAVNGSVDKGTVAETTAYNVVANYKKLTMTTATDITLGDKSVGLYSKGKGTDNADRNTVTNTGNITVGNTIIENKGTSNERRYPAVAIYAENTNLNTNSAIRVGNDGIAFYGKNSDITAKGSVNFSNNGVLAYLENSKFVSYLGNLGATKNTMMYLKNSIAQLDGAGTKVDIEVADNYTGAYIEGNSQLTGVKTIKLGENFDKFLKKVLRGKYE